MRNSNFIRVGVLVGLAFPLATPAVSTAFIQKINQTAENASGTRQPAEKPPGDERNAESGRDEAGQPKKLLDLSSPRATMATFLRAIDEAGRGEIERYADALACLDLSGLADLPEDARGPQGRKLASALNAFIDKRGVELVIIPDTSDGESYAFPDSQVEITRHDDGRWLFSWDSLAFVRDLPVETTEGKPGAEAETPAPAEPAGSVPKQGTSSHEVPAEFRSARATMRTFSDAIKAGRISDAAKALDLSDYPLVIRKEKGDELATILQEIIKRTKEVVLQEFSDDPNGNPHIFLDKENYPGFVVIARQGEGDDRAGQWLFTKETMAGLDAFYDALPQSDEEPEVQDNGERPPFRVSLWIRAHIPESLKGTLVLLQYWQWLALLAVLLLGRLAQWIATSFLRALAWLWLKRSGVSVDKTVQLKSFRPLGILAASAIWWVGLTWLSLPNDVFAVLLIAVKFIACWATVWTVYRAVDLVGDYCASLAVKTDTKMDDLLVPLLRKVAKTVVTVLGLVFIVQQFTEDKPFELLAGLGLGGLALALAAQDTLKNLFGSLTVILDRPFKVGDWVLIGDVEGTVESVGFRSTRIRTFYNSQVVVPNSTLASATIDNYGARQYRRVRVMLSITYDTPPEKVDAFCEGVRELIRLHPYTRKDYYHVYFNKFSASSLDILLYAFFEVPDWGTELRERHRLFVDIMKLAKRLGVAFAFPTQTVWLERGAGGASEDGRASLPATTEDPHAVGLHVAADVFEESYGPSPAHREPVIIEDAPLSPRRKAPGGGGTAC